MSGKKLGPGSLDSSSRADLGSYGQEEVQDMSRRGRAV